MKYIQEIYKEFTDDVTKYLRVPTPKSIEEEEKWVMTTQEKHENGTDLRVVVTDKEGEIIGCGGIIDLHTKIPELGLRLKQSARGKGYGKEMIGGLIKRIETHKQFDYIMYRASKQNTATRKIAESFGGVIQLDEQGKEKIFIEHKFDNSSSFEAVEYRIPKK